MGVGRLCAYLRKACDYSWLTRLIFLFGQSMLRNHDHSPDPLAIMDGNGPDECIKVDSTARKLQVEATPTSRGARAKPVIEIVSSRKRPQSELEMPNKKSRTPLGRASPSTNRGSPTPGKITPVKVKAVNTPTKTSVKSRTSLPSTAKQSLAASISKSLPTPSPSSDKRPRTSQRGTDVFDVHSPSATAAISRETFLANEALRRQREARKFVYEGDTDAPTLTRSAKIVGEVRGETEERDEYGDIPVQPKDEVVNDEIPPMLSVPVELDHTPTKGSAVIPLPTTARPLILKILSTLNSSDIPKPQAFAKEEQNDALNGLVNLLKGTVERGEGNSALVVGSRGVGKTRVSDFPLKG